MEWMKKHADTMIILGAFATSMLWMNGKFNTIEKDIVIIKTVLIMKQIMPCELAQAEEKQHVAMKFVDTDNHPLGLHDTWQLP